MADRSGIEWTDATWNPVTGCSVVSPGCTNCYAMRLAGTRLRGHPSRAGLTRDTKAGPVWTGEVRLNEGWLTQPLGWARPRDVFVCAHADLFHPDVPEAWIDRVFAVMALARQHTYQLLTKRGARMRAYCGDPATLDRIDRAMDDIAPAHWHDRELEDAGGWPLLNVWLGVSAEDQRRADERRADLAALAAAGWTTFASYEPALGPVDWTGWGFLSWLISGGENGPRPSHPDWHRAARDFCAARGIAYLFKQWGSFISVLDRERDDPDWRADYSREFAHGGRHHWLNRAGGSGFHGEDFHVMRRVGKAAAGRLLDGVQHDGRPGAS